ncbi:MAG: heme-copper oxidase subunit III, partial [Chitinophagaceae bacterium]|nr:heme-copper oxidase subunit III [Chitinophagaceae bacterium]
MDIVSKQQKKKIHPHKFTLWVAMGSIIMMFAGLTSAFIVKSNQAGWKTIGLPKIFWVSTAVILISSIMIQLSLRSFKNREMTRYRLLLAATMVLGIVFVALQW